MLFVTLLRQQIAQIKGQISKNVLSGGDFAPLNPHCNACKPIFFFQHVISGGKNWFSGEEGEMILKQNIHPVLNNPTISVYVLLSKEAS